MREQTLNLMKELVTALFTGMPVEQLLERVSDDFYACGLANDTVIEGKTQLRAYLASDPWAELPACELALQEGKRLSRDAATLSFTVRYRKLELRYRMSATSRLIAGTRKICTVHVSAIPALQSPSVLQELTSRRVHQSKQALLDETTAGGMMGGYLAEGFPFYFINERMLTHLGYQTEEEFVADIDGLIEHCMHPEDVAFVREQTLRQIEMGGAYQVDYRMRKKDGSYIRVHDIGRKTEAEDGREAIISVCYDVTAEKEHSELLDNLVNDTNGGMALYRVEPDWRLTLLFASEGVGAISGRSNREYEQLCRDDSMLTVCAEDRRYVLDMVRQTVTEDRVSSFNFRIPDKNGNCRWIHALYSNYGVDQGRPVIRAIFLPASNQYDLQIEALDTDAIGVYVIDRRTEELYYANDACFRMHDTPRCDISGKTCHEVFFGCETRCESCWLNAEPGAGGGEFSRKNRLGRTHHITVQNKQWNNREVAIVYIRDVTDSERLQEELRRNQAITEAACAFANMWTFTLDVESRTIYSSDRFCQEFGFPKTLERFPESVLERDLILPEYRDLYRDSFEALYSGTLMVEFDIETRYLHGDRHWMHFRAQLLPGTDGAGRVASISAQEIDAEKAREARLELERKRIQGEDNNLLYYFIVNAVTDQVIEHKSMTENEYTVQNGMTLEELIQTGLFRIRFEADREKYAGLHKQAYLLSLYQRGETQKEMECQMVSPSGKLLWVRCVMHLLSEPNTNNILLYEYLYRIDGDKMIEGLLNIVLDSSFERCGMLNVADDQYMLLELDPESSKISLRDVSYRETMERYANERVYPSDRAMYLQKCEQTEVLNAAADRGEFRYRSLENGEIRYKKSSAYLCDAERGICLLTRSDITDIVRAEEREKKQLSDALEQTRAALAAQQELSQDRERLHAALFSIVPMVISANVTQNYYSMLNYDTYTTRKAPESGTYEELIAVGVPTVPEEQREVFARTFAKENVLRAFESGQKSVILEHQQLGDDGVMRWIETRSIFVPNRADGDLYTITLAQDISERKRQQVQLKNALEAAEAATQAKSEFLSRMSHEIRTPMNAIMGMTAIAKENRSDFQQVADCLDKIDMSAHYLLTLINDILEMSRIESGKTEIKRGEFSFNFLVESIRTVVEPLAIKGNIRYDFLNTAQTDACYLGDMMRIQQVMVNLLTNAIKFTRAGGRVRFSVAIDSQTETTTRFRFVVADTGIGMSKSFMQKMFRPFVQEDGSNTSQYGGSGLGLAISKSLVEAMGGRISVESFLGIGSTFTVELPLERLSQARAAIPAPEPSAPKQNLASLDGRQILMAEDHHLNVMVACKLLERRGVHVTVADNGQIAVDKFRASAPGDYDAILMDIRMPVMDGLDAARAIRALDRQDAKTIPIIAMTANALDEDRQNSRAAGMNAHLAKPFEPAQLYAVLAEQIAEAEQ